MTRLAVASSKSTPERGAAAARRWPSGGRSKDPRALGQTIAITVTRTRARVAVAVAVVCPRSDAAAFVFVLAVSTRELKRPALKGCADISQ